VKSDIKNAEYQCLTYYVETEEAIQKANEREQELLEEALEKQDGSND
jgi:hypothetical protein